MKKIRKSFVYVSPILVFLLVWGISLGKCEILTLMHGDEFWGMNEVNNVIGEQKHLKILHNSDSYAKVYYVAEDSSMANILSFTHDEKQWRYNNWERCVWSISGNADDVVWPYWWHFFYVYKLI